MILNKGNMWSAQASVYIVTTNSVVQNSRLVMGAGAALQLKQRIPDVDLWFGECITSPVYGFLYIPALMVGAFQTKEHWRDKAKLRLIEKSAIMLANFANCIRYKIVMNFPGIGYGGLAREHVLPLIQILPDNVHVYEHAYEKE